MASMKRFWGIALLVLIADQVTKYLALGALFMPPRQMDLLPFFNLTPVWNRGISFGMFQAGTSVQTWTLVTIAVLLTVLMILWARRAATKWTLCGYGHFVGMEWWLAERLEM